MNISLTECNSGTTQNFLLAVSTTISFKNITAVTGNNGVWWGAFRANRDTDIVVSSSYIFGLNCSSNCSSLMVISNKNSFIYMNYVLPQNCSALSVMFPPHILGKYAVKNLVLNIFEVLKFADAFNEINLLNWQLSVLFFIKKKYAKTLLLIFTFHSQTQR
jgi:hypothetical protein